MFRITVAGRTCWCDKAVTTREGKNGENYDTYLFRIASNRDYEVTRKKEDGTTVKERPVDYMLCRVTGKMAAIMERNLNLKDEDGKIISRLIEVYGELETYKSTQAFSTKKEIEIDNETYEVTLEDQIEVERVVINVKDIQFLDKNPAKNGVAVSKGTGEKLSVSKKTKDTPTAKEEADTKPKSKAKTKAKVKTEVTDAMKSAGMESEGESILEMITEDENTPF